MAAFTVINIIRDLLGHTHLTAYYYTYCPKLSNGNNMFCSLLIIYFLRITTHVLSFVISLFSYVVLNSDEREICCVTVKLLDAFPDENIATTSIVWNFNIIFEP